MKIQYVLYMYVPVNLSFGFNGGQVSREWKLIDFYKYATDAAEAAKELDPCVEEESGYRVVVVHCV